MQIVSATSPIDIEHARTIFREYEALLGIDLCFQGFEQELAGLPGAYAPPAGRLLLAADDGTLAGCGALRPLGDGVSEMKRLYVRPGFRGRRVGRRLATALIEEARALGFVEIVPYTTNPVPGALFMERRLA